MIISVPFTDFPSCLPESDRALIREANDAAWEDINTSAASTPLGRRILHDIAVTKYHYDEAKVGMI